MPKDPLNITAQELQDYFGNRYENFLNLVEPSPQVTFFVREFGFSQSYSDLLNYESICEDILNVARLTALMKKVNRSYQPTFCGAQHGDDEAALELGRIIVSIADENLKDMD